MKIVSSLWLDPILHTIKTSLESGVNFWNAQPSGYGVQLSSFFHMFSLSILTAKINYKNIELVTDPLGAELCSILQLPFSNIQILSNDKKVPHEVWAYYKFKAYELQTEPFFHIDTDVFLNKRLPHHIENSNILVQDVETIEKTKRLVSLLYSDYEKLFNENTPESYINYSPDQKAYCMGIFGGNDLEFINQYSRTAIAWCENETNWKDVHKKTIIMPKIEQQLLYCEAIKKDKEITCIFDKDMSRREVAEKYGYVHAQSSKYTPTYNKMIFDTLKYKFPSYHKIVEGNKGCLIKTLLA
mgnify:CR=1 FL=1